MFSFDEAYLGTFVLAALSFIFLGLAFQSREHRHWYVAVGTLIGVATLVTFAITRLVTA